MESKWNLFGKRVMITFVAALLAATNAFAVAKGPSFNNRDVVCEEKPGPFAFNYAKDLGIVCPSDFYVYAEFLLMQAQEQGLEYAIHNTTAASYLPLTGGDVYGFSHGTHDWDWQPGFRIGFGAYLAHDAWMLEGKWTFVRIKSKDQVRVHSGTLVPLWLPSGYDTGNDLYDISTRWRGKFNVVDLRLGKPYHPSRYFILNPFIGIRAGWLDQDYTIRHSIDAGHSAQKDADHDYWGVGSSAGLNGEWVLGAGWNIFGTLATSILFGKYDITQSLPDFRAGSSNKNIELDQKFYQVAPNLELILGIQWGHLFNDNKFYFSLRAAYEFHYWWHQNYLRRFVDTDGTYSYIAGNVVASPNDFSLNGFSFRVQFDF